MIFRENIIEENMKVDTKKNTSVVHSKARAHGGHTLKSTTSSINDVRKIVQTQGQSQIQGQSQNQNQTQQGGLCPIRTRSQRQALGDLTNESKLTQNEILQYAAAQCAKQYQKEQKNKEHNNENEEIDVHDTSSNLSTSILSQISNGPLSDHSISFYNNNNRNSNRLSNNTKLKNERESDLSNISMIKLDNIIPKRDSKSFYHPYDVDSMDKENERSCWEYAEDITRYHLKIEKMRIPNPLYMSKQNDITGKMRCILIDWLVDVHVKYELLPQTLYLAISLLDRYLERDLNIVRQNLQLAGITALFIASKYEEIYPPEAMDFVRITDNAYTMDELIKMENQMLVAIGYRVTVPTAFQFLQRWIKVTHSTRPQVIDFAKYVMERTLQEYKMLKYRPSMIAAASIILSRIQYRETPVWNSTAEFHSGYSMTQLQECIEDLRSILWNASNRIGKFSKLTAVQRKYAKERFGAVSTLALQVEPSPTK